MQLDTTITPLEILTLVGLVISIGTFLVAYVLSKRQDRQLANRQIYQRLELASIGVFQNEINHPKLADIWKYSRTQLAAVHEALPLNACDAFLFQQLNLFEMAYAFSKQGLVSPEVFGSWVIWFGNLCTSPYFRDLWTDADSEAPLNYIRDFRDVMTAGCEIYSNDRRSVEQQRVEFFAFVGNNLKCPTVSKWLS